MDNSELQVSRGSLNNKLELKYTELRELERLGKDTFVIKEDIRQLHNHLAVLLDNGCINNVYIGNIIWNSDRYDVYQLVN